MLVTTWILMHLRGLVFVKNKNFHFSEKTDKMPVGDGLVIKIMIPRLFICLLIF
ncbi:Ribosomal RNA small subunit methyltransferase G [Bienertia sinuspersici]